MTESNRNFAAFNSFTFQGRLFHAEEVTYNGSTYLSVSLIGSLENDAEPIVVKFANSNGLLTMFRNGKLNKGRQITVTGHLAGFAESYEKDGKVYDLTRKTIKLTRAVVFDGGMGPGLKAENQPQAQPRVRNARRPQPVVEKAPELAKAPF